MDRHPATTPYHKGDLVAVRYITANGEERVTQGKVLGIKVHGDVADMVVLETWDHTTRPATRKQIGIHGDAIQRYLDAKNAADLAARRAANQPSDKQIRYALDLIRRVGGGWRHTQWGQGMDADQADEQWLRSIGRHRVSLLIDELIEETGGNH
jgi:hypothetical protein